MINQSISSRIIIGAVGTCLGMVCADITCRLLEAIIRKVYQATVCIWNQVWLPQNHQKPMNATHLKI